ncbi:cytochrome d ubiquinol oxidase subunit II [Mobiluncus porci]|nr:cytochrome d ubiquinol oxidase subunit II [Mobiluncus porci]
MVLQVLWFILVAVLWSGYLILEGYGLGTGMLLRILGKTDEERGQMVRAIGPHWDGNEVWLLTAGGATFASSPEWYAVMFSGMYIALFLILLALIGRIAAIEWRNKLKSEAWRSRWDTIQMVAGWLVPILLGVAFANLVQGMKIVVVDPKDPFTEVGTGNIDLSVHVHNLVGLGDMPFAQLLSLLTPFGILGGLVIASLALTQGALFLSLKTTDAVHDRAVAFAPKAALASTLLTAVFAVWGTFAFKGEGFIFALIFLVIAAVCLIVALLFAFQKSSGKAFIFNSAGVAFAVAWVFAMIYPYVMKSSVDPAYSLTIWDSAASPATQIVMTIAAVILVPVVLGYTIWSVYMFRARIAPAPAGGLEPGNVRAGANFLVG